MANRLRNLSSIIKVCCQSQKSVGSVFPASASSFSSLTATVNLHTYSTSSSRSSFCSSRIGLAANRYNYSYINFRFVSTNDERMLKSAKVSVSEVDFHYTQTGNGDHTVLLLPGALGSAQTDFLPQLNGLSEEKYNIICFDPRGYGKSRPPDRDWPLQFLQRDAYDAAAFMKALSIPRYSVLGWSDGGITGMILAAAFPANVQRLLIWGSNAYITPDDMKIFKDIENVDKWSPRMREPFIEVYGEEYFRKQWQAWVEAYNNYFTQRNGDICVGSLPNIKCPTMIVNGHKDPLVLQEHPQFLQKHIVGCRMVDWPEGKHNLHLRYAKEFNLLAEQFLDEQLLFKENNV